MSEDIADIEAKLDALPVGGVHEFVHRKHHFSLIKTNLDGFHTGRPRYAVLCLTCDAAVHPATTGPVSLIGYHLRDIEHKLSKDTPSPIPMRLHCSECHGLHVDEELATKPHHTHACQFCGNVWRPALVETVGVKFLPGFKDDGPLEPKDTRCGASLRPITSSFPANSYPTCVRARNHKGSHSSALSEADK